nr:DUF1571 domain-containing protein [Citrobacter tructae]
MRGSLSATVMPATLLVFCTIAYPAAVSIAVASALPQIAMTTDPISLSQQSFDKMQSYQVVMLSSSTAEESKIIRYSYKKPGYVRMDFTQPHAGAVLTYNPVSGKVKLWPFGLGTLPVLSLSPTNSLIQDERGHRVDRSDIGVLLGNIRRLQREGTTTTLGVENLSGRSVTHVSVVGARGMVVDGVHRYDVWLDNYHGLPAKVMSYTSEGKSLETVLMDAMIVNLRFPADFFTP